MQSRVIFRAHLSRFYDRRVLLLEAREVWIRGTPRDIFHFYAPSRSFILVIFAVDMLYGYVSHRERSRVIRELAVIVITCAGVGALYLFYLYRFGNPFIVSSVEATNWKKTLSVANLFNNVRTYGFQAPTLVPFNYAIVPILLVDILLVVATILALVKRDLALSAYSFVSLDLQFIVAPRGEQLLCALHRRDISVIHFSRPHALRKLAQEYRHRHNCHRNCDAEHVHLDQWGVALLRGTRGCELCGAFVQPICIFLRSQIIMGMPHSARPGTRFSSAVSKWVLCARSAASGRR